MAIFNRSRGAQIQRWVVLGRALVIPKRSATTYSALILGSPVPTPTLHRGAQIQRWGVLGRALVIPKRSATTCSALILGSPVPTPTLHRGAQIQRWGVLGRALVIPKRSATTCSALILGSPVPTPALHRGAQTQHLGGARRGTGDTKTECYCLFSTHFGITSEHTKPHSHSPYQQSTVPIDTYWHPILKHTFM